MANLNFPNTPTLNQIYTANGSSWKWDGTSWIGASSAGTITAKGSANLFSFSVNFSGNGIDPSSISNTPANWTITIPSTDVILVKHDVGSPPVMASAWGLTSDGVTSSNRITGLSSINMTYNENTKSNTFMLSSVSTTTVAAQGNSAVIWALFP